MTTPSTHTTSAGERLAERLAGIVATVERSDPWGSGRPLPIAVPADLDQARAVLALARADGLRIAPVGRRSKLAREPRPVELDLLLSSGGLDQLIAFEGGDGTLTAQAGASLEALDAHAAAEGRRLTPRVPAGASLGGAIATGETGADRLQSGPLRNHLLGLEVLLGDGRTSRSGGRLVKNVAGYDLHRLHCGGRGGFGLIVEATLRLFPAWHAHLALERRVASVGEGLGLLATLDAAGLRPLRTSIATKLGAGPAAMLRLEFAGREEVVELDRQRATELLGSLQRFDPDVEPSPSAGRAALRFDGPASAAVELAEWALELAPLLPAARLVVEPKLAIAHLQPATDLAPEALLALLAEAQLKPLPARCLRFAPSPDRSSLPPEAVRLAQAVTRALDPHDVWVR